MSELIDQKKLFIKEKTGCEVVIIKSDNIHFDALIDFPNWHDKSRLPTIYHREKIDLVHVLHELIHLENFFIDKYSIIGAELNMLSKIEHYKKVPEDYLVHKILKYKYNFNPIDRKFFLSGKCCEMKFSDVELAVNLVFCMSFIEFCPERGTECEKFYMDCKRKRPESFVLAKRTLRVLNEVDYGSVDSYNSGVKRIIEIFSPGITNVKACQLQKINNEVWKYIPM